MGYKSVTNPASNSLKLDNHSVLLPKSKSMSNLRKGLIVLGAALGFSIATWGTVKLVKYLNNKKQNDGSTPLAGDKLAETRKMMDDALKKDWVIDKSSVCHCKVAGHISGVIDSPKSLNFSLFKKDKNKVPGELDKWVDFHIKEIRETFSENKDVAAFFQTDGQTEDTKKFEYLIFSYNGQIIKIGFIKSTKQLYDLEFAVYDYDKDKCNCCWSFKLNNPK